MPIVEFWPERGEGRFTPIDADGKATGEPIIVQAESIEVNYATPAPEDLAMPIVSMAPLQTAFAEMSLHLTDMGHRAFADLYEALTGRRWRPTKASRRAAKRRKLDQRRRARAGREPGRDWRADMPLYRRPIGSIARGIGTTKPRRTRH